MPFMPKPPMDSSQLTQHTHFYSVLFLDSTRVMLFPGLATYVSCVRSAFNVMYYWIIKALAEDQRH